MVKKILFLITKEISGLHHAAYLLGFFTLLSQVLGLVRDRLLAYTFGVGPVLDIYYAAFRIPDFVLVSAASLVSISVLVPFLTRKQSESETAARTMVDNVFTVFFSLIVVVSFVLFFFIPDLTRIVFPGITEPALRANLIELTRILLLSPILLGTSNLFASILQIHKRFFIYALSPLLYNIGIIFGIIVLYPLMGIPGLAYGVVLGAFLHMGVALPFISSRGYIPLPKNPLKIDWSEIKQIMFTSLPRTATLATGQLSVLVLLGLASLLESGSISVFSFAYNLHSVPLAIIGASYSLAAFPTLSRLFTEGDFDHFAQQVGVAVRHIVFWASPAIVLFIVLRAQIVRVVLGAGEFGWPATRLVAAALGLLVISVLAQSLTLLLIRGYYAANNTIKPLIASAIGGVIIIGLAYVLMQEFTILPEFMRWFEVLMRVEGLDGTAVLVLPLSYSIGVTVTAGILLVMFQHDFSTFSERIGRTLTNTLVGSLSMGVVTYGLLDLLDNVFNIATLPGIFFQGLLAGLGGLIVGIGVLWVIGSPELHETVKALRKRFWRVDVSAGGDSPNM